MTKLAQCKKCIIGTGIHCEHYQSYYANQCPHFYEKVDNEVDKNLIIHLIKIKGVINERNELKYSVKKEISRAISERQIVDGLRLIYTVEKEQIVDDKKEVVEELHVTYPHKLESKVNVSTETFDVPFIM